MCSLLLQVVDKVLLKERNLMERKKPKIKNGKEIPVNIYKGQQLAAECPSIQAAARWLKQDTNQVRFNWSAINNGIWFDQPYSFNGITYYFTTDHEAVKNKLVDLKSKVKETLV
jgi:hypothetical protein